MKDLFAPATRRWIYGVAAAMIPLLITLGAVTSEIGGAILNVIAAALGLVVPSLAASNTDVAE